MGRKKAASSSSATKVGLSDCTQQKSIDECSPSEIHSSTHKRTKLLRDGRHHNVVDDADDPFSLINLTEELASGKYGSLTKEIEDLCLRRSQMLSSRQKLSPSTSEVAEPSQLQRSHSLDLDGLITRSGTRSDALNSEVPELTETQRPHTLDLDGIITYGDTTSDDSNPELLQLLQPQQLHSSDLDSIITCPGTTFKAVESTQDGNNKHTTETVRTVVFDAKQKASFHHQEDMLEKPFPECLIKDFTEGNGQKGGVVREEQEFLNAETERKSFKGLYVGVQDDLPSTESSRKGDTSDGLEDAWREMTLAYEWSKIFYS